MEEKKKSKGLFSKVQGGISKFTSKLESKVSEMSGVDMNKIIVEEKELIGQKEKITESDEKKSSSSDLKKTFGKMTGGVSKFMNEIEEGISKISGGIDVKNLVTKGKEATISKEQTEGTKQPEGAISETEAKPDSSLKKTFGNVADGISKFVDKVGKKVPNMSENISPEENK